MSKKDKKVEEPKNGEKIKRFALSTEERSQIQNIQSVLAILSLQRDGLKHSLMLELARTRKRLNIVEKAPEGYDRMIDFDDEKYELLVIDVPKPKEPVNKEMPGAEAKDNETAKN